MSEELIITREPERNLATRREQIERRLHDDISCMAENYIDIGRCLNIAKDGGLVPHGEWIAWVREHAQMNERNAQRVMRAAREIGNGSPLARLDFSKVTALLAVPADEREDFAREIDAESLSVRQLQAAVKARDEAKKAQAEAEARAAEAERAKEAARLTAEELQRQLTTARTEASDRAQQEIDRLQEELSDSEAEARRRAKAESEAKDELLRLRTQMARGTAMSGEDHLTPDELATATRAFIGQAAVLPHMGAELARCDGKTRAAYRRQIDMLADWCQRARAALETLEGEVISCE